MSTEKDYTNPYGVWEVTTECDRKGEMRSYLGIYIGFLDEIAFALADRCSYSLRFKKINTDIPSKTVKESVCVTLDVESKTWHMNGIDRVDFFQQLLSDRSDISITNGRINASVILRKKSIESKKREIALAKLTDEEKELLGLR